MEALNDLFVNLNKLIASFLAQFLPGWAVDLIIMVLVAITLLVGALLVLLGYTYFERKVVGRMQDRIGPNRVGPLGLLQPIADVIKILIKEDITPRVAHRWVHTLAPILIVPPVFLVLAVIPFGRGMVGTDLNIGFLYVIAVSSTATIAIFMAGWGSRNKYALLGAMRAVAQIVSYEIPQVLSVVGVLILAGSLSMVSIVEAQRTLWFVLLQPIGFLIFLIASVAEINRTPFDLPEAESEIVAGYHIEYSGLKFAMFYLAEYLGPLVISAIAVTLFLGGWQGPLLPPYVWFFLKSLLIVFVIVWLRSTLPRLRVDQLMNFAWKFLVPLALANLLMAGLVDSLTRGAGPVLTLAGFTLGNLLLVAGTVIVLTLGTQPA
ncbi:MAG: NADH-quinone oxidoreductase subunit NuoH, partial [Anaerolineae bacterium]